LSDLKRLIWLPISFLFQLAFDALSKLDLTCFSPARSHWESLLPQGPLLSEVALGSKLHSTVLQRLIRLFLRESFLFCP